MNSKPSVDTIDVWLLLLLVSFAMMLLTSIWKDVMEVSDLFVSVYASLV